MGDTKWRATGQFANWLEVSFTRDEIVLDFGQAFGEKPMMHTRIVTTARSVEDFLETMSQSLAEQRRKFSVVRPGERA